MRTPTFLFIAFVFYILFSGCEKQNEELPPDVIACFSYTIEESEMNDSLVVFTNCSENAVSYFWDFGDSTTSDEINPTHRYTSNGLFIITLKVSYMLITDTITGTIHVDWIQTDKPLACFTYSYEEDENEDKYVSFSNCSENADSYTWDFSDSNTSEEENPTHDYSNDGSYIVKLIASNEFGSDTISDTVIVNWNNPDNPIACFNYSYQGDEIWETYVVFTNCSENADSYLWDFGDGTTSVEENPVHYYSEDGMFTVSLTVSNESGSDSANAMVLVDWTMVDKPNIYLYPDENIELCLSLEFPEEGQVIKSIPLYNDGWCVSIDASGKIDNEYDYLFYESVQPDVWQYEEGWCIKRKSLTEFFEAIMGEYEFSDKEIKDFIDYWIPRLVEHEYYNIYPQLNNQIEKVIQLNFSIEPDNVFRLFYGIIGTSEYSELPAPEIEKIKRDGFTVVEWGVFRK